MSLDDLEEWQDMIGQWVCTGTVIKPAINTPTTEADSEERTGDTVQEQLRTMSEQLGAMQELIQASKKPRTGNP